MPEAKKRITAPAGVSRKVPAGEFKARCLAMMDRVRERGGEYVITKHGKPVARLVPVEDGSPSRSPFGWMKGTVTVHGDIISPIDVEWAATSDE